MPRYLIILSVSLLFIFFFLPSSSVLSACNYDVRDFTSCPEQNPEYNLEKRGWENIDGKRERINFNHDIDTLLPQLNTLIEGNSNPAITSTSQVHEYDWANNKPDGLIHRLEDIPSQYDYFTVVGFQTSVGQNILAPKSGYNIGGGNTAIVVYATSNQITLKYVLEDDSFTGPGYGVHLVNLNVNPQLLACYQQYQQAGRTELPALSAGEIIGTASGNEILVALRDTGSFMDPRWNEWWYPQSASSVPFICKTAKTNVGIIGPSCTMQVPEVPETSRPFSCDNCSKNIPFPIGSCAQTPTIRGRVTTSWTDSGVSCDGNTYAGKEWGGSIVVDPTSVDIPFVGRKGAEDEKKYLADYFEGTGFYYSPPYDYTSQIDRERVVNEGGVWRKLAPAAVQNNYKKAMIYRAEASKNGTASNPIHDYLVSYNGQTKRLAEFIGHFPPDPKDYDSAKTYNDSYQSWKESEWGKLWPAVPMFSREDTNGEINLSLQSPYEKFEILTPLEQRKIKVPHVARLFEAVSAVQALLFPLDVHSSASLPTNLSSTKNDSENTLLASSVLMSTKKEDTPVLLAQGYNCGSPFSISIENVNFSGSQLNYGARFILNQGDGCQGHLYINGRFLGIAICPPDGYFSSGDPNTGLSPIPASENGNFTISVSGSLDTHKPCGFVSASQTCMVNIVGGVIKSSSCGTGGPPPKPACGTTKSPVDMCEKEAITGSGDTLCCNQIKTEFIAVDQVKVPERPDDCINKILTPRECAKNTNVGVNVDRKLQVTLQLPLLGEIWNKLADEKTGVFNIFTPREIPDFEPTEAKSQASINYSASGDKITGVDPGAGEFYYPKLGGMEEAKQWLTRCLLVPGEKNNPLCSKYKPEDIEAINQGQCIPDTPSCPSLTYNIDFKNPNNNITNKSAFINKVLTLHPKSIIGQNHSAGQTNLDFVIEESKKAGWNPLFVVALWLEETGASHYIATGQSLDAFGCLPRNPKNLSESLNCLFNRTRKTNNFEEFMLSYSSLADLDRKCFCLNPNFPVNIWLEYNLVKEY